jgi:pilus assembly protein CpaF
MISMQDIFTFRQTGVGSDGAVKGYFQASGVRPRFMERLKSRGIQLPEALFDPSRRME